MEDIYTIKVRTNPDPRDLYPSERRYSASTVLGLSVVHLALAITALLLASLSLSHNNPLIQNNLTSTANGLPVRYQNFTNFNTQDTNTSNHGTKNSSRRSVDRDFRNDDVAYLDEDSEAPEGDIPPEDGVMKNPPEDTFILQDNTFDMEDLYTPLISLILSPCFMALGALLSGTAGVLAWKRWYIDHNIKWFFFMSSISTITSLTCLTITALTLGIVTEQQNHATTFSNGLQNGNAFIFSFSDNNVFVDRLQQSSHNNMPEIKPAQTNNKTTPNIRMVIAINLLIASVLEFIWSVLSTRISWKGMRNSYPDDIILSRGKMETNTTHKGNKKHKLIAPDILNHHPKKKKFAKYFPKKQDDFLPKLESNKEYRERVDKFLSSNILEPDN